MDGFAVHAAIDIGSAFVPDDLAANHHRVDGKAVHPTHLPRCPPRAEMPQPAQVNHAQPGSSIYNHAHMIFVKQMGSF